MITLSFKIKNQPPHLLQKRRGGFYHKNNYRKTEPTFTVIRW